MLKELIFKSTNADGHLYEEVFELNTSATTNLIALYSSILDCSIELISDCVLASAQIDAELEGYVQRNDFAGYKTLFDQFDRARTFADCPVTIQVSVHYSKGNKKTFNLCELKGLKSICKAYISAIETNVTSELLKAKFTTNGLDLLSNMIYNGKANIIPTVKQSAKSSNAEAQFKALQAKLGATVKKIVDDDLDDDIDLVDETINDDDDSAFDDL